MPVPQVVFVARQFKQELAQRENWAVSRMAQAWGGVQTRLDTEIGKLSADIMARRLAGLPTKTWHLYRMERYQRLVAQVTKEVDGLGPLAQSIIQSNQTQHIALAALHADRLLAAADPKAAARLNFDRLPVPAVANIVAITAPGAPLAELLADVAPLSAQALARSLVNGVALGHNPRQIAREAAASLRVGLARMTNIARTETLRAYRTATQERYMQTGIVMGYQRVATHDARVCVACLAEDGSFYALTDIMPEHPQGRCAMIPVTHKSGLHHWEAGNDWLLNQSPATQQAILGKGRWAAWKAGLFGLDDIPEVVENDIWGPSLRAKSLAELTAGSGWSPASPTPKPTPAPAPAAPPAPPPPPAFKFPGAGVVRVTDFDIDAWDRKSVEWAKTLTQAEKSAVSHWSGSGYASIRANISAGHLGKTETDLLGSLQRAPKVDGLVWRGISIWNDPDIFRQQMERSVGTAIEWDTLSSATLAQPVAARFGDTVFEIHIQTGRYMNAGSNFFHGVGSSGESELLVMPNTKFRVVSVMDRVQFDMGNGDIRERLVIQLEEIVP